MPPSTRHPVAFIPGFPASSLRHSVDTRVAFPPPTEVVSPAWQKQWAGALRSGNDPGAPSVVTVGEVIDKGRFLGFPVIDAASTLHAMLIGWRYDLDAEYGEVPWDWRLPVDDPATQLRVVETVERVSTGPASVVVICHSTGGLVLRALLEGRKEATKELCARLLPLIREIVTIGVPWVGTLKSLQHIGPGKAIPPLRAGTLDDLFSHAWAAYDLLPPDPASTDMTDRQGNPLSFFVDERSRESSPLTDQRWMKGEGHRVVRADHAHARLRRRSRSLTCTAGPTPPITNIVGWGIETITSFRVRAGSNGRTLLPGRTPEGDGTIPRASAEWLHAGRTFIVPLGLGRTFVPVTHSQLWRAGATRQILEAVLCEAPLGAVVSAAADAQDVDARKAQVHIRLTAADARGQPLPNCTVRFLPFSNQGNRSYPVADGELTLRYSTAGGSNARPYRCALEVTWLGPNGASDSTVVQCDFWFR
jgi:hypothetical protein